MSLVVKHFHVKSLKLCNWPADPHLEMCCSRDLPKIKDLSLTNLCFWGAPWNYISSDRGRNGGQLHNFGAPCHENEGFSENCHDLEDIL